MRRQEAAAKAEEAKAEQDKLIAEAKQKQLER